MSHRLFIFVSQTLRADYLNLGGDGVYVVSVPQGQLAVEQEPPQNDEPPVDPWETELKNRIASIILGYPQWQQARIRVAGHLKPCFGSLANLDWQRDQRFPEKEQGLQTELGLKIDLQIWGFHHKKEWSEIWTVARQIKEYFNNPSDQRKADFFVALEEAFERSTLALEARPTHTAERVRWEGLSVLRHEILGLFDPLRIRLETAREIKEDDPLRAREIGSSVEASLTLKIAKALKLLAQFEPRLIGSDAAEGLRRMRAQLGAQPDLSEFGDWLNQLDDSLNNLRNSVME